MMMVMMIAISLSVVPLGSAAMLAVVPLVSAAMLVVDRCRYSLEEYPCQEDAIISIVNSVLWRWRWKLPWRLKLHMILRGHGEIVYPFKKHDALEPKLP